MRLRQKKVIVALKKEISSIIQNELGDKRLGFVTIISVDLSPDLRFAQVYFSVLGGEKQQKAAQQALKKAKPLIRYLVGQRMSLRYVPEIVFKFDQSTEYSIRIQEKLNRLEEEDERKKSH